MTDRLIAEAQAALDAVRIARAALQEIAGVSPLDIAYVAKRALHMIDARLKALEGKCPLCGLQPEPKDACADIECPAGLKALEGK